MTRKPTATKLASLFAVAAVGLLTVAFAGPAGAHDQRSSHDDPAGTISSFDPESGKLVIDLADGDSIAGLVTRRTWIKSESDEHCDDDRRQRTLSGWCRDGAHSFGDDHGGHHGRGDIDDLVAGAVVEDAILVLTDGRALFVKIELDD